MTTSAGEGLGAERAGQELLDRERAPHALGPAAWTGVPGRANSGSAAGSRRARRQALAVGDASTSTISRSPAVTVAPIAAASAQMPSGNDAFSTLAPACPAPGRRRTAAPTRNPENARGRSPGRRRRRRAGQRCPRRAWRQGTSETVRVGSAPSPSNSSTARPSSAVLPGRRSCSSSATGSPSRSCPGTRSRSSTGTATRPWPRRVRPRPSASPTAWPSHHIDAIYVTSLRRTVQTAAPLAARLGLEPIVERDLREVHLGDWEGELYRQRVAEGHPIAMRMITEERWDVIPGAESADSLRERVGGALRRHRGRPRRSAGRRRGPRRRDRRDHGPGRRHPPGVRLPRLRQRLDLPRRVVRRPLDPAPLQRHQPPRAATSTARPDLDPEPQLPGSSSPTQPSPR